MPWFAAAAPYIAGGLTAASSLASANGAQQSGAAAAAASQYNANVELQRAQIATQQSQTDATQVAQDTERRLGQARADFGAAGVVPDSGSPLLVMSDQAAQGELARQLTLYRGQIAALSDQEQAQLDLFNAGQSSTAGNIRAGTTLLTGAGRLFGSFGGTGGAQPSSPGGDTLGAPQPWNIPSY